MITLFAAGVELGIPHLSTPMLILIGILLYLFWPRIKAGLAQPEPVSNRAPPSPALPEAQQIMHGAVATLKPSVATEFAALENLLAQRDSLHAEVGQALARAKALIDKETAAAAVIAKP